MNKRSEQFDFSTPEDQKEFENLPQNTQTEFIRQAQEEADILRKKVENGEAKDYEEAYQQSLIEGEIQFSKNETISGEKIATALNEYLLKSKLSNPERFDLDKEKYEAIRLDVSKYAELLHTQRHLNPHTGEEGFSVNGIEFYPIVPFVEKEAPQEFREMTANIINNSFFQHTVSGYGDRGARTLEEVTKSTETLMFRSSGGFFVTSIFNPWHKWGGIGSGGSWKTGLDSSLGTGERRLVIHFNEHLMDLMTPRVDKEKVSCVGKNNFTKEGEHIFKTDTARSQESGHPERIVRLLGGTGKTLSHYNDTLGILLETEAEIDENDIRSIITFQAPSQEIAEILSDHEPLENNRVRLRREGYAFMSRRGNFNLDRALILSAIKKITPQIISGIVEYDKNFVVTRVALSEQGKFRIFNQKGEEESIDRSYENLTRKDYLSHEISRLMREGRVDDAMNLWTAHGHQKIKIEREDIEECYKKLADNPDKASSIFDVQHLLEALAKAQNKIDVVAPSQDILQKAFRTLLRNERFKSLKRFHGQTNIDISFLTEEEKQEALLAQMLYYSTDKQPQFFDSRSNFTLRDLQELEKILNTKPSTKTIQSACLALTKTANPEDLKIIEGLKNLQIG